MALRIVRPGLLTTVQDCGRWGYQSQGVPVSGAMDGFSHRVANALVGNSATAATLEITLTGPEIEFLDDGAFSVSGAVFGLTLNGTAVATHARHQVAAGGRLVFGERTRGARAYLAVSGGIDVPAVLGSRSTHLVSRMGGLDGRALKAGDVLRTGKEWGQTPYKFRKGSDPILPVGGAVLRIIPGSPAVADIVNRRFTISPRSDRMGYRLEGPVGNGPRTGVLISSAVPTGAIQVPPTGGPILLMSDHATTGGYEMAGTVISPDLPVAGQLAPGDSVEFRACDLAEADNALRDREAAFAGR